MSLDTRSVPRGIYLLATLDTKGAEAAFVADTLRSQGRQVVVVDCGCIGTPDAEADISRGDVMAAGGASLQKLAEAGDRGQAIDAAAAGAAAIVDRAWQAGSLEGMIAIGGSAGTSIGAAAMRTLPIGVPKVMVSTMASGDCRPYVGHKDICMMYSVVDIAGVNRISRAILFNAAMAIAGMTQHRPPPCPADRRLIAATMFGVTTPCVTRAREVLEAAGYEVLVFHATGSGGQAMESLIDDDLIDGVLDITTTELADELVGGVLSAGPTRLTAAARNQIPQVVSVGALDMVNFGGETPSTFDGRLFYKHNPTVTLMRTTADECRQLGAELASKVSASTGPAAIMLPQLGVSAIDGQGQPFDDPIAREALFEAIRENHGDTELVELNCHINAPSFAEAAARKLLELMAQRAK